MTRAGFIECAWHTNRFALLTHMLYRLGNTCDDTMRSATKDLSYVRLKASRMQGLDIRPPALSVRCLIESFSGNNFRRLFTAASVIFHNSIYFSSAFW